jgi:hypothetical protein
MTDKPRDRQGGAWIGQHPDANTDEVREELDEGAERAAVTNNESGARPDDGSWPRGHGQGDAPTDDTVRESGQSR